jgi:hypothetical protein
VLLTFEDYKKLVGGEGSIIDKLGQPPGVEEIELDLARSRDLAQPPDLR